MRYIELKCYIYILRDTASYRNDFFYPHGALFYGVLPGCFAFCCVCYGWDYVYQGFVSYRLCVLRVWLYAWCGLALVYRVACCLVHCCC